MEGSGKKPLTPNDKKLAGEEVSDEEKQKSFIEANSVPVEKIIENVDISGLHYNPEFGKYISKEYDPSKSWSKGEGDNANATYIQGLLSWIKIPEVEEFMMAIKDTVLLDLGSNNC